jgi:predicted MPP superfamily phosphohydrolase
MRNLPPGSAWRVGLAALCAFGLWAFVVNHWLMNLTESLWKRLAFFGLAAALGALALGPLWSRTRRQPRLWPWVALSLLFALGEARRLWLRNDYRVETPPAAPLFTPITTTALRTTRFALRVPGLPVERLRVVHLTDLHVTEALPASYPSEVIARVQSEQPDLLVFTGDYLARAERLPLLVGWLEKLPRVRYGSFAVLGNHDYWTGQTEAIRGALERAGVHVLTADCARAALGGDRHVALCGTDAPWGPALDPSQLKAAQRGASATLVLSHTPDNVYELGGPGANAVFAGHTHGGQMRVPGLGALLVPSRYGRRFDQGHFLVEGTHLFVSAGIGADAPPLRLWCPPELVVVELLPATSTG